MKKIAIHMNKSEYSTNEENVMHDCPHDQLFKLYKHFSLWRIVMRYWG